MTPVSDRVAWTVHRETALLLGWGRAILLQFAHPLVARAVSDHSAFRSGALAPWRRLHATVGAMLALTFGPDDEARRALDGINAIHDRVHGRLPAPAGPWPAGAPYSAHDPELLRWVHVTCVDSFLLAYERFVAPLSDPARDQYCLEASAIESGLGLPPGWLPRTRRDLDAYVARMRASGVLVVTDPARRLADALLSPPGLRWVPPVVALVRLATVGLLPPDVRAAYGFPWSARRERLLRVTAALVRRALPWTPAPLRYWPSARAAERRERGCIIPARARH